MQLPTKKQLVKGLLGSLHYQDRKKEDSVMIEQIFRLFDIPDGADLQNYLVEQVSFSQLFAQLMQLIEPFTQMLNEIYAFLASYRSTARTADARGRSNTELRQLVISELANKDLSFDLEAFPQVKRSFPQPRRILHPKFNLELIINHNVSPLYLTKSLLSWGYDEYDINPHHRHCSECEKMFREKFQYIFAQLEFLIKNLSNIVIPPDLMPKVEMALRDFDIARKRIDAGIHAQERCYGHDHWEQVFRDFVQRFERVMTDEPWIEEIEAFLRFFALPFWEKRSQLYEVWVLIHFLRCIHPTPILNIQHGEWRLMYGQASQPVAYVRTTDFVLEVWFQRLELGKTYTDTEAMPDIQIFGRSLHKEMPYERLFLIECKEREGENLVNIQKLASHYHNQVPAKRSIYCNYLEYTPSPGCRLYRKRGETLCDAFKPGSPNVLGVDKDFKFFLQRTIKKYRRFP